MVPGDRRDRGAGARPAHSAAEREGICPPAYGAPARDWCRTAGRYGAPRGRDARGRATGRGAAARAPRNAARGAVARPSRPRPARAERLLISRRGTPTPRVHGTGARADPWRRRQRLEDALCRRRRPARPRSKGRSRHPRRRPRREAGGGVPRRPPIGRCAGRSARPLAVLWAAPYQWGLGLDHEMALGPSRQDGAPWSRWRTSRLESPDREEHAVLAWTTMAVRTGARGRGASSSRRERGVGGRCHAGAGAWTRHDEIARLTIPG